MTHAEKNGIFIFRHGLIELEECRGFTLADPIAPFVYLNSGDALAGLLFTLAHELCHIWIQESGVSNSADSGDFASSDDARIEVFCNAVASEVLLPSGAFNREWTNMPSEVDLKTRIRHVSNLFKVSEETVARKLLEQNELSQAGYRSLRHTYQKRWEEIQAMRRRRLRESPGGPSYYLTKVTNNGYAYTQTVISAYRSGSVSGRDAAALLDAKINHLDRLSDTAGIPASLRA
jgi:Zn-dependent peptidase ImmA (M78 family)